MALVCSGDLGFRSDFLTKFHRDLEPREHTAKTSISTPEQHIRSPTKKQDKLVCTFQLDVAPLS